VSRPFHRKQYRGWSVTAQSTWQKSVASIIVAGVRTRGGGATRNSLVSSWALLYDGAAARSGALNSLGTVSTARQIAEVLLDAALPEPGTSARAGG
jgi:hypothetical protein